MPVKKITKHAKLQKHAVRPSAATNRNDAILQTATSIFAKHGYHNTDVQLIADELGIGKGTIYRNFPTKQELFFAALDWGMERLHAHMNKVFEQDLEPLEGMKEITRQYFKFFERNTNLVELFIQERAEFRDRPQATYFVHKERNMSRACNRFNDLISKGVIKDMPIKSLEDIFSSLFFGTLFVHYFSRRNKPLSERAEQIIEIVIMNILKPQANQTKPLN
jgi:AcrR family transcriptional regulator